ncbi:MAG TPA: hypothetical protein VFL79_19630 [Terriglobia bacterium]|nr:hypothetical protein [Terriglobia bacterium]
MKDPKPVCTRFAQGKCPRTQLVLLDDLPTHYAFGCMACKYVTIVTKEPFNRHCREEGERVKFMEANKEQRKMFLIHKEV